MGIFYDFLGQSDVFLERMLGTVDHYGSEAVVHALLAYIKIFSVIQVQGYVKTCVLDGCFYQLYKICRLGIFAGSGGHLEDEG